MSRHELVPEAPEPAAQGPDAGLAAIAATFAATVRGPAQGPAAAEQPRRPPTPFDIWPLRLPPLFIAAAGTVDGATADWACPTGRAWELLSIVITLGSGATLVSVYDEAPQPANLLFQ